MKIRTTLVSPVAVALLLCLSQVAKAEIPFVLSYFDSTWHSLGSPYNYNVDTIPQRYTKLANMGVNIVQDDFDDGDYNNGINNGIDLDLAQANGMLGMADFHDGGVRYEIDPTPNTPLTNDDRIAINAQALSLKVQYSAHPSLLGYNLRDEPHMDEFEALAYAQGRVLLYDLDALPVVDLFPNYANSAQLGTSSYDFYVSEFVRVVKPKVLSFNNYLYNSQYFSNLVTIRKYALQEDIPFWYIFHAHQHHSFRDPTEGELRWQMYNALAYGAKGVRAFTYSTIDDPNWSGVGNALVDLAGNPTAKYYMVQEIYGEIATLSPILNNLTSFNVSGNSGDNFFVTNISGGDAVYGNFTDNDTGKTYMMFTNKDFGSAHTLSIQLDYSSSPLFNGIGEVSKIDGRVDIQSTPGGVLTKWLEAGDGALYRALDDITPSSTPGNLTSFGETTTSIDLNWNSSIDNESGIDYYVIYRNGVEIDTSTGSFFTDTELLEDTSYSYRISAVNGEIVESGLSSLLWASTISPGILGDFNSDGVVDGNDFIVWQRGESPNSGSLSDLALWEANFGNVASPATAASVAVPEPTAGLLLMLGFVGLMMSHRRIN